MKKRNLCLLALAATLSLASCAQAPKPSGEASSSVAQSTPTASSSVSQSTPAVGEWNEEIAEIMVDVLGTTIPYVALSSNYDYVVDEDEDGLYIYIFDESTTNAVENYGEVLEAAGFVFEDLDDSEGYDVYFYSKETEDGVIIVQFGWYPGDNQYPAGNDIFAWVMGSGDDEELEVSETWPTEAISELLDEEFVSMIPAIPSEDGYGYYVSVGVVGIFAYSEEDLTESYIDAGLEKGLLLDAYIDWSSFSYVFYLTNWEENFMVEMKYDEDHSQFGVYISESAPSYDAIEEVLPVTEIAQALEVETEVPNFTDGGKGYKVTYELDYGYVAIKVLDDGEPGVDALEDVYVELLEAAGWSVDDSQYDEEGYIATSPNKDLTLSFFTELGTFVVYAEPAGFVIPEGATLVDMSTESMVTTDTEELVVFSDSESGVSVSIAKGSATANANNYIANGDPAHSRVYKGGSLTIKVEEGTLGTIAIMCTDETYANTLAECTMNNCTAEVDGNMVILTPTEGASECSIDVTAKHVRIVAVIVM